MTKLEEIEARWGGARGRCPHRPNCEAIRYLQDLISRVRELEKGRVIMKRVLSAVEDQPCGAQEFLGDELYLAAESVADRTKYIGICEWCGELYVNPREHAECQANQEALDGKA